MWRMRRSAALAAGAAVCLAWLAATPAMAANHAWEPVTKVPGIFDVGGPRTDGWLVVAGSGRLYLVDPLGAVTPFAQGPGGYADDAGAEAYLAVSPGLSGSGCEFTANDVYVLRVHAPLGVTKVDRLGLASPFATVPGVQSLNGIAFDTVGGFGHRLLVTGPAGGGATVVAAIDCSGAVEIITRSAPTVEGGLAVAPPGFAPFGGALIAPDELTGNIYAIAPDGTSRRVVSSGLPVGADVGVESLGFVPLGMHRGGEVYYSDRGTPGNPHPGTDSLLRLPYSDLESVQVEEGDLLAATEGGAAMIWVRCALTCSMADVVSAPTTAHGEGHLAFRVNAPPPASPSPTPSPMPSPPPAQQSGGFMSAGAAAVVLAVVALAAAVWLVRRRRRRT
jgi:hypothetical protein